MNRHSRLGTAWEYVSSSLWALPSLLLLLGPPVALAVLSLDRPARGYSNPLIYRGTPAEAMEISSTLLTGMITMTSLVFSITIVVLTLAASNYGPRLVRSFMSNWYTQFVLGIYVFTIAVCLVTLFAFGSRPSDELFIMPSVSLEIGLSLVSVLLLVFFLHNLGRSIVAENLIEKVGEELDNQISTFPKLASKARRPGQFRKYSGEADTHVMGLPRSGYVQAIDIDKLVAYASRCDLLVHLRFRPGDYVVAGGEDIAVEADASTQTAVALQIERSIRIGSRRTPLQDPEFSIRHLVEIALRALSPGINDPHTAAAVVDRLCASLARGFGRNLPPREFYGENGELRVRMNRPSWDSLVGAAFNQIRQSGSDKPMVMIHLVEAINRLAQHATVPDQVETLTHQLRMIVEDARAANGQRIDIAEIEARAVGATDSLMKAATLLGSGSSR
jgi:uncharacterized membrane protein